MQILLLLFLASFTSAAAVFGTQCFLTEKRPRKKNARLWLAGALNAVLFTVLADCVIRAGRPDFYYHTHRPGLATVKIFAAACFCGAVWFALLLMLSERKHQRKTVSRWLVRSFLLSVCGAVLLEIVFFNFRHFELIGADAPEMEYPSDSVVGQGFYFNRADWKLHPYSWGGDYQLVVYTRYQKIRNITWHFDDGQPRTPVRIGFNDQAHRGYEWLPEQEFIQGILRSFTVPLHTVGTTYSIALDLPAMKNSRNLSGYGIAVTVSVNQPVPLTVDPVRMTLCFLALFLISAFFPGSPLWYLRLDLGSTPQTAAAICLLLLVFGWFIWTVFSSYTGSDLPISEQKAALTENYSQYDKLVEALMVPSYSLTEIPHRYLEQLDDPYDMRQREGRAFDYPWDTVYYQGRYYVYFGVVPAAAVLLPYRLLTGNNLELDFPILGFCCLFMLGLYGIYTWFVRRFFRGISFGTYFIGLLLLVTSLNLTWCLRRTLVYELAITSGICFAVWGVFLMLLSCSAGKMQPLCFFASGACSALAVGCRPTMVFVMAAVLVSALYSLKAGGKILCGRNIRNIICFLIPYVLAGLALMKYNYERFGDPLEFGITYQLTTENRAVGIPLLGFYGRLLSILSSLFTFPEVDMVFPFIHLQQPQLAYNGVILNSDTVLGAFAYPVMLFLIALPVFRQRLRRKGRFIGIFSCSCLLSAGCMLITSSAFAVTNRYLTDWLFLAALPAVFGLFCFFEKCSAVNWPKLAQVAALVCAGCAVCLFIVLSLTGEDGWFRQINPLYYDRIRYAYSPWL